MYRKGSSVYLRSREYNKVYYDENELNEFSSQLKFKGKKLNWSENWDAQKTRAKRCALTHHHHHHHRHGVCLLAFDDAFGEHGEYADAFFYYATTTTTTTTRTTMLSCARREVGRRDVGATVRRGGLHRGRPKGVPIGGVRDGDRAVREGADERRVRDETGPDETGGTVPRGETERVL